MQVSQNDFFNNKINEFNHALKGLKSEGDDRKSKRKVVNNATKCMSIIREIGVATNSNIKRAEVYEKLKLSLNSFNKESSAETMKKINKMLDKLHLFIAEEEQVSTEARRAEPEGSKGTLYHVPSDIVGSIMDMLPRESFLLSKSEKTHLTEKIQKDKRLPEEALKDAKATINLYKNIYREESSKRMAQKENIEIPELPEYNYEDNNSIMDASKEVRRYLKEYGPRFKELVFIFDPFEERNEPMILPHDFAQLFPNLDRIAFEKINFLDGKLPPEILECKKLKGLALIDSNIINLPEDIGLLKNLKKLILKNIKDLNKLPESFKLLKKLEIFDSRFTHFSKIPPQLRELPALINLDLMYNHINSLPDWLHELNLKELRIDLNFTNEFPKELLGLKNLEVLYISNWDPANFPDDLPEIFPKLEYFFMPHINIMMAGDLEGLNKELEIRKRENNLIRDVDEKQQ